MNTNLIKAVCAENLYKLLFSRSEIDHFITRWYSFPSAPQEPGGSGERSRRGTRADGMDLAVASRVGRSCQALPVAGSVRSSPPSLPGAGGLEEPLLCHEGLAQPWSAFAVVFNLSAAGAVRELDRSRAHSAGVGRWL